jgi:hypothetical protein
VRRRLALATMLGLAAGQGLGLAERRDPAGGGSLVHLEWAQVARPGHASRYNTRKLFGAPLVVGLRGRNL